MDKKTSSTKRRIVESTENKKKDGNKNQVKDKKQGKKDKPCDNENNTNQGGNQSFCEDQKDSKNINCEKDSDKKNVPKGNKVHHVNTIDSHDDIERNSLVDNDDEKWIVQRSNKKKTSHQSLSEEKKYKNDQKQIKLSDSNSKQNKTHDNINIDSHENEDTHKLVTKRRKRPRDKKKKNSQEENDISDIDSPHDDKFNQTKVHDGNSINLHEEDTQHLSNDDSEGSNEKKKKKNSQEQNNISDIDSSIVHKLNQKKVYDGNNINLPKEDSPHLFENYDSKGQRDKNKNKNSQKPRGSSDIDSSTDDKSNQKKVHDGNNINLHKEDLPHLSVNDDSKGQRDKNKNKNSQKQRGFSDIDSSTNDKSNQKKVHDGNNINLHKEDLPHLSVNDDSKGQRDKNKNKNSQKQRGFSDIDSSTDDKSNQKKVHDGNNINLHKEDLPHLSVNDDSKGQRHKKNNKKTSCQSLNEEQKSHNNSQKQSKRSEKDMKQAHDGKNIDFHKDICNSEESERPWDKKKNNNGQKQSRFSDACIIDEIDEDIFKLSNDYSLAHCVAEDLRMGAGIAVDFKRFFGGVGKLVDQKLNIGDVGIVKRHDQYAFYLVTKKTSTGKPKLTTMEMALNSLLNKMKELNLTKLGIPKIGCGLDKLDWSETKLLISKIFSGSGIHITVCVPSKLLDSKTSPKLKVYITPRHLWEMESETIIILFIDLKKICNNNWTDHIVDKVDAKYPFKENLLKDVKNKKLDPGDTKLYKVKNEFIICIFTSENKYYGSLENGFKTIDHKIKGYKYLAIQSDPIGEYSSDNFQRISWIVLISRSVIVSSELWLCGDVNQKNDKMYYDEYCRNLLPAMNSSFQYNSPNQKYNRYNDDRRSNFYTKGTSNQY